jgi:AraC-like DNA-binding protein
VDEVVLGAAQGPVAAHVSAYAGYRSVDVPPARHRGLPSPWLTVVLALHEPLRVDAHPDPRQAGGEFVALVGGLHTSPALLSHDGRQSGVQLSLSPLSARALLGVPAGELAGIDVHAEDLMGPRVRRLRERLLSQPSWERRFAVLDRTLGSWLADVPGPPPEVTRAWRVLLARGGDVRVDALARHVGWSTRHLGVRFRHEVGVSVKQAMRIVRFDRARRALQARPATRLSDLAAAHGFCDQAHLAREFRDLAGLAPSRWLAAEGIASVQAGAQDHAAGSAS